MSGRVGHSSRRRTPGTAARAPARRSRRGACAAGEGGRRRCRSQRAGGGPVTLDVEAPLHRVELRLDGAEVPMSAWADPIEIEGVDLAFAPFLNQQDHGVFANRFVQREASGSLELRLAPPAAGAWARTREDDGPARLDAVPERWLATSAREASSARPPAGRPARWLRAGSRRRPCRHADRRATRLGRGPRIAVPQLSVIPVESAAMPRPRLRRPGHSDFRRDANR